ncbi:MAG: hypothetical protein IT292_04135 [Deltaproteobacteria bacterium]|nr:hypothetical protein [Deltaproteobacteria bacterium]
MRKDKAKKVVAAETIYTKDKFMPAILNIKSARSLLMLFAFSLSLVVFGAPSSHAQSVPGYKPKNTFMTDFFKKKLTNDNVFDGMLVPLDQAEQMKADALEERKRQEENSQRLEQAKQQQNRNKALGRISADAPDEFKEMMISYRMGDMRGAEQYAGAFVDYMMNLMFEVKQITNLIGKALINKGAIKEDDFVGVGQYADMAFAEGREDNMSILKPTHEEAMKRITPDTKNQAEIYYFFTLSCTYCREMAADIERLWQVTKGDKNLRMAAMSLVPVSKTHVQSYRDYTGMTLPIFEGSQVAKSFNIGLVPAVVIVAPNSKTAYIKSGKQEFARLYEFARTVQGLPAQITPEIAKLMETPIGKIEQEKLAAGRLIISDSKNKTSGLKTVSGVVSRTSAENKLSEKF